MNPHQKKFVSQTEAVFSFLNDRGIQIPCEQELSEKEDREMAFKKKAYRNARDEMKELLIVKANVDRILGIEKDAEIEKDEPTSTRS